jgi:hypothetical protein
MARIVGGMATSHAFALLEPERWPAMVASNRKIFASRYGHEPALDSRATAESLEANIRRYECIRDAHRAMGEWMKQVHPHVLIIVGDDQDENFGLNNLPAFALYSGVNLQCRDMFNPADSSRRYAAAPDLAGFLAEFLMEEGLEMSVCQSFPEDNELKAHAYGPVLRRLGVASNVAILPNFVSAIHWPAPKPARCWELGLAMRRALSAWKDDSVRVAFCASGGLSHFSATFPYDALGVKALGRYGSIHEEFDREIVTMLQQGGTAGLARLTSRELLEHGGVELRSWIVAAALAGDHQRPRFVRYEPFYSAIMGMGVALWDHL